MPALRPPPPDYRQHLEIETPEHVVLDLEIAGIGSRALAAVLDMLILGGAALAVMVVLAILASYGIGLGRTGAIVLALASFLAWNGYFILFEGLRRGQTPGKRMAGIRVVMDTGHAVTFGAAAVRNLLRVADFLPPPYLIGVLLVAFHPRAKRLGDIVAGTVVSPGPAAGARRPRLAQPRRRPSRCYRCRSWTMRSSGCWPSSPPVRLSSRRPRARGSPRACPAGSPPIRRPPDRATWLTCSRSTPPSWPAARAACRPAARPAPVPGSPPRSGPAGTSSSGSRSAPRGRASTASPRTSCPTSPPATARSPPT